MKVVKVTRWPGPCFPVEHDTQRFRQISSFEEKQARSDDMDINYLMINSVVLLGEKIFAMD